MPGLNAEAQIFATLEARDPDKQTLCVGGAAIAVHLAAAGVPIGLQADIDVLCSHDFYVQQCGSVANLTGLSKFQIRWPYGDEDVRALSPIIDMYPDENHPDMLPFSACEALGGTWFPINFQECMERSLYIRHQNYMFLNLETLLLWTARSGREKDIAKLEALLPIAHAKQLVTESSYEQIMAELETSKQLRLQFPERHHARIRNGEHARS